MNKALFLDRDGIINEDSGYIHKVEDIKFVAGIFELCKKAIDSGYIIIVITNQSGVARGYYTETHVETVHNWILKEFEKRNVKITKFYYSTYHPEAINPKHLKNPNHRKPAPGMIMDAVSDYNIDISKSFMIGDKQSDRIDYNGLKSYIVKSVYSKENYDFSSLEDIINSIKFKS